LTMTLHFDCNDPNEVDGIEVGLVERTGEAMTVIRTLELRRYLAEGSVVWITKQIRSILPNVTY